MHIILTHENADCDAIASLLGAHKLYPDALPILPERINANAAAFINLYKNGLPFLARDAWQRRKVIQVTLVDTQRAPSLKGVSSDTPTEIIDHHELATDLRPTDTYRGEVVGANVTLLVEQIAAQEIALTTLEATLLTLGLYEDTGSFTYGRTTPRDLQAGAWLVTHGAALDTVRRFLDVPLSDEQRSLYELLLTRTDSRRVRGYTITVAEAQIDTYIPEISRVVGRLQTTLDSAAIFVLVATPSGIHLICRSTTDDIDVGAVARAFGGGGHTRAAAATIPQGALAALVEDLWRLVDIHTQPAVRIAELMSYGVQTVDASARIGDVIAQLRRIGHEGYPVVEDGRLVGLLTRRDADRAGEHGLGDLSVRDIMQGGSTTLTPDDSIDALEQTMLDSGWGQIPVLGAGGHLIGIVTRTDLIKHWAQAHPRIGAGEPRIEPQHIANVLGASAARLIERIAQLSQAQGLSVYMVGGGVRDLLLRRRNLDIDFVVEGDAIAFADSVQAALGGDVTRFRPFGTAKWSPDATSQRQLEMDNLPDHIDFASARNEFYEHPTALPTVYSGSIKLDLQRRDFTINALAIQISPTYGRILDFYGGMRDLETRQIRVLHSLSFIDDPTRILRAVRFEQRLDFAIEARTEALIAPALPMLGRITGERVRNELDLLLREPTPEAGLLNLARRGVLTAIHPAFLFDEALAERFRQARDNASKLDVEVPIPDLYWLVVATRLPENDVTSLCERLLFPRGLQEAMLQTAQLRDRMRRLRLPDMRPSEIASLLDAFDDMAVKTHLIATEEDDRVRARLTDYLNVYQHVKPAIDGHQLKAMGLKPGPCFKQILDRLRAARLDGEVETEAAEKALIERWVTEGICDDDLSRPNDGSNHAGDSALGDQT